MTPTAEERFFTPARVRAWCIGLLGAYLVKFALLLGSRQWPLDANGHPVLIDFVWIWAGAQVGFAGDGGAAYNYGTFSALQESLGIAERHGLPYYYWVYPPFLLLVLAPLALLTYSQALAAWLLVTLVSYLAVMHRILPDRRTIWMALLPYGAAIAVYEGQTAFLLAALLGLTLWLMPRQPISAGICLGLVAYKPQYGPLFPVVLLLTGQWRVIAAATATILGLVLVSAWVYGWETWAAFLHNTLNSNVESLQSDVPLTVVVQTAYGVVHWLGGGSTLKWLAHAAFAGSVAIIVCVIARGPATDDLKAAALAVGALAVTPYMMAYDLLAVAVPIAFLLRDAQSRGFLPGERYVLALCLVVLLFSFHVPVGPLVLAALLALVVRRVRMVPEGHAA